MSAAKNFPIGVILNFADSRLLTSMDDVYEFANFMTGDNLFTHQLIRAHREIQPVLKQQLPWLASPEFEAQQAALTEQLNGRMHEARTIIDNWLVRLAIQFGPVHSVTPLAEWMKQCPVSELIQMRESREGIILVEAPSEGGAS